MRPTISYNVDWQGTALVEYDDGAGRRRAWRVPGSALVYAETSPESACAVDGTPVPPAVFDAAIAHAHSHAVAVSRRSRRLEKLVVYCGTQARVACDGQCGKAWGVDRRPSIRLAGEERWLTDEELTEAPVDPHTRESGDAKPVSVLGPEDMNRWCSRQCERCVRTPYGRPDDPISLRDFTRRVPCEGRRITEPQLPEELLPEALEILAELDRVADALGGAPARVDEDSRERQTREGWPSRHPWQVGSLEQICRNHAGDVRALARRVRLLLRIPTLSPIPSATATEDVPRDERD